MKHTKYIRYQDMTDGGVYKVAVFNEAVPLDSVILAIAKGIPTADILLLTEDKFKEIYMKGGKYNA